MRDHAIPQDITGYRFHIIGQMTLKQFAELGAGVIVGVILYATNLIFIIKWPLIGLSVGFGAAAAFLPFEERPLDHWLTVFIKNIYRPTKFYWKREPKIPEAFQYKTSSKKATAIEEIDLTPAKRRRIKEYIASVDVRQPPDEFELAEQKRINSIMEVFSSYQPHAVEAIPTLQKPMLKTIPRSLKLTTASTSDKDSSPTEEVVIFDQPRSSKSDKVSQAVDRVAQNIEVPVTEETEVDANQPTDSIINSTPVTEDLRPAIPLPENPAVDDSIAQDLQQATLNISLPFPSRPTDPNKVVGMILTPRNELIPDTIVEIKDEKNKVVRAVKTNALGQFFISTPLRDGSFTLLAEKDGFHFQPIRIDLDGKVVDPIEIRSV